MRDLLPAALMSDGRAVAMIVLTADFEQEDGLWIGTCLELGTSTQAETLDELRAELKDAIDLQLNEMARLGYTREYLRSQGVKLMAMPEWEPVDRSYPKPPPERWGMLAVGN